MPHEAIVRDGTHGVATFSGGSNSTHIPLGIMSVSNFNCASTSQAKRTLETQLADTDRRIQDASRLGSALLSQKQELVDRLKEIAVEGDGADIGPDLRKRLLDLERDYNEIGQETARVLVPRSRKISQETLDITSVRTHGTSNEGRISPAKANVLPHKPSNSLTGRVHDIQFATDISASLLGQVRSLQGLLAERDETVKVLNQEKANMQSEAESLGQKLRGLDDSEQRHRDENWSLETQLQDLLTQAKESQFREQRLNQALSLARTERTSYEKELDEIKHVHNKLNEEHEKLQKQHDTEATGLRRSLAAAHTERDELLHKVHDLSSHNSDLAHAITTKSNMDHQTLVQRQASPLLVRDAEPSSSEHSPPPSPSKNTPRPGALESETLKSSLHHAHRMIQNLKTNIHREKTEKLELKRLLQDARDEVEMRRTDGTQTNAILKKRRAAELSRKFGKSTKLGSVKYSHEESVDDSVWEDHDENGARAMDSASRPHSGQRHQPSDAFETANERDSTTETETFHTGVESLAGDSTDELTETEDSHASRSHLPLAQPRNRTSFLSTASDEGEEMIQETPQNHGKYKIRMTRSGVRRDFGSPKSMQNSPASFRSNDSSAQMAQTLAAELENLDDASTANSTPTRPPTSISTGILESDQATQQHASNDVDNNIEGSILPEKHTEDRSSHIGHTGVTSSALANLAAGKLAGTVRGLFGGRDSPISAVKNTPDENSPSTWNEAMIESDLKISSANLRMSAIMSQQTSPLNPMELSPTSTVTPLVSTSERVEGQANSGSEISQANGQNSRWSDHGLEEFNSSIKEGSNWIQNSADIIQSQCGQTAPSKAVMVDESPEPFVLEDSICEPAFENAASSSIFSSGSPPPKDLTNRNRPYGVAVSKRMDGNFSQSNIIDKRPLSSWSVRKAATPPLPVDHKEAIAAATKSSQAPGSASTAGIAAATPKAQPGSSRPRTPASLKQSPSGNKSFAAPPRWTTSASGSRRSSLSSFASEVEERLDSSSSRNVELFDSFEMRNADPRMIQAITQTMIGEFLWKYTRKAGRGDHSDNRHRRFFWIHPYTRTLYWSNQDPSNTGRTELKAKSVGIEAVRVVSDENPMPPGLHPKSIVVVTPGRNIKFTAPTSQRHETWFNALSYLLLRTGVERQDGAGLLLRHHGSQSNFIPKSLLRHSSKPLRSPEEFFKMSARDTPSPSASTPRNCQPFSTPGQSDSVTTHTRAVPEIVTHGLERPEVFKKPSLPSSTPAVTREGHTTRPGSIASRLRPQSGLFGIKRETSSRNSYSAATSASQSGRQSRSESLERRMEKSSLENVRACCDGKHDVGSLIHRPRRNPSISSRTGRHRHQTTSAASSAQHLPQDPGGFHT